MPANKPESLDARFATAMGDLLGPEFPTDIALAVSGGGDSMAMLYLAHNWARVWGLRLWVVTVDHGLRPEAAEEAAMVAEECAALGHPHCTLRWHWDGQGNLMDAARRGRHRVIDAWRGSIRHVLYAHTRNDVAETFLMRLKRGSGVDGLSAMAASQHIPSEVPAAPLPVQDVSGAVPPQPATRPDGFTLIRPCLDMTRDELRHYARTLQGRWVEDPTNEDDSFDRARMRKLLARLEEEGLGVETLAATADRMARARDALQRRLIESWERLGGLDSQTGHITFDRAGVEALDRDTQMRLLAAGVQLLSNALYRPRAEKLETLLDRLLGGGGGQLSGVEAWCAPDHLCLWREFAAVQHLRAPMGELWDGQWMVWDARLRGDPEVEVRALGDAGWQQAKAQAAALPDTAPVHRQARSLPSLWRGDTLLACDALGIGPGGTTQHRPTGKEMFRLRGFLLTH